ncbi:MAG: NAD(P)-dependent oxidoreductase [Anaerolineae bacterium]
MSSGRVFLVTGSMGCIGAWTLFHLVRRGESVVSFDLSANRARLNLLLSPEEQEGITFVLGDLTQYEQVHAVMRDHGVTHVVHLGALQIPFCRANPVLGAQVNVVGTVNIYEAAKQNGVKHVSQASSLAVYGTADEYPPGLIAHDAPRKPHSLYGVYKVACEGIAHVYWSENGVGSTSLRPYTVYGPGRDQGLTSEPTKAMLAAAAGKSFDISFGGRMQFQYASDVAQQFIEAALDPVAGAHAFNLGTEPRAVAEVAAIIMRLRPGITVTATDKPLPFPEGTDDAPLRAHAQVVYDTPLEDGIRETIEQFESLLERGLIQAP